MPVGLLTLELHIPDAQSLKDKRQVLRSLKDRLRGHFNVAVAELDAARFGGSGPRARPGSHQPYCRDLVKLAGAQHAAPVLVVSRGHDESKSSP